MPYLRSAAPFLIDALSVEQRGDAVVNSCELTSDATTWIRAPINCLGEKLFQFFFSAEVFSFVENLWRSFVTRDCF